MKSNFQSHDSYDSTKMLHCDYLIVGSGVSGLYLASKISQYGKVIIVTKDKKEESSTYYAQGGIAAAVEKFDSYQAHYKDTIKAGGYLCDKKAVRILVREGVKRIQELISMGMQFTRNKKGNIHLHREGGHKKNRILHIDDITGREIVHFLLNKIEKNNNITFLEKHIAIKLLVKNKGKLFSKRKECFGILVLNEEKQDIVGISARHTFLATGGAGNIYSVTTNPSIVTGDGVAMAYNAGCPIRNLEYYQFHPTALYSPQKPIFLLSEAIRGFGGVLKIKRKDKKLYPFMHEYSKDGDLSTRDVVSRSIYQEMKKEGSKHVYLDTSGIEKEKLIQNFPNIYKILKEKYNIDMSLHPIPVIPAAHYMCGGVQVNYNSQSNIQRLFVIGESSSTGVHGKNRLASNSLLEGIVFTHRAFLKAISYKRTIDKKMDKNNVSIEQNNFLEKKIISKEDTLFIENAKKLLQQIMWQYIGIECTLGDLEIAKKKIDLLFQDVQKVYQTKFPNKQLIEMNNLVSVSKILIESYLKRKTREKKLVLYNTNTIIRKS